MKIEDYIAKFGNRTMLPEVLDPILRPHILRVGMLAFNEETACAWGGPFEGGYAGYTLKDYRVSAPHSGLHYLVQNDLYLSERLRKRQVLIERLKMPSKADKQKHYEIFNDVIDFATTAKPIRLYMFGNDDTSFSKFYATTEEALAEVDLLEACEPLDFYKDLMALEGFVFTN